MPFQTKLVTVQYTELFGGHGSAGSGTVVLRVRVVEHQSLNGPRALRRFRRRCHPMSQFGLRSAISSTRIDAAYHRLSWRQCDTCDRFAFVAAFGRPCRRNCAVRTRTCSAGAVGLARRCRPRNHSHCRGPAGRWSCSGARYAIAGGRTDGHGRGKRAPRIRGGRFGFWRTVVAHTAGATAGYAGEYSNES